MNDFVQDSSAPQKSHYYCHDKLGLLHLMLLFPFPVANQRFRGWEGLQSIIDVGRKKDPEGFEGRWETLKPLGEFIQG